MLVEVPSSALGRLRPLFADIPGLHGCIDAALEGAMGLVYADNVEQPALALIDLDFYFIGGDPNGSLAAEAIAAIGLPASIIISGEQWMGLLERVWGDRLLTRTRVAFSPGFWDIRVLRRFAEALPAGYTVRRIAERDVDRFEDLAESLVYNFRSRGDFAKRGVGFGVEHGGRFVSGCSSFARSSRSIEFEIQTHPDFRRRGLASAAAAALIEYCLDEGLEPCWDAHNSMSAALATKLGFVEPAPYTAYEILRRPET